MKKIRIIAALILSLCLFSMAVVAAPFTPSVEDKEGPTPVGDETVAEIYDTEDKVIHEVPKDELIITPLGDKDEADEDTKKDLEDAEKDLKDKGLTGLVPGFEDEWKGSTGGAPIDNAVISDIFDIRVIGESAEKFAEGTTIGFTLDVQGLDADDKFVIIRKGATGWEVVEYTMENGNIRIKTDELGVFAIVRDSGAVVIDPNAPDSPQTGVADYTLPAVLGVALLGACAVVFGKKAFNA